MSIKSDGAWTEVVEPANGADAPDGERGAVLVILAGASMRIFGLPPLTYLKALLSGSIGRWAVGNDAVLNEVATKIQGLEKPGRAILLPLLMATNATAEYLLGYQRKLRLLDVDLRNVTLQQFRELYSVLLTHFVDLVCFSTPALNERILADLTMVLPDTKVAMAFSLESQKLLTELQTQEQGQFDQHRLTERRGHLTWEFILRIFGERDNVVRRTQFLLVYPPEYLASVNVIRKGLGAPGR